MAFQRDFNDLLNEILTAYQAQFPGEVTQGSVLFVRASCTASMLWGLYQQLDRVSDQMFVASADRPHKERHAAEFGIATVGRTDAQIVDDVLAAKRSKLAGGNRYDYIAWAKEALAVEGALAGRDYVIDDVIVVPLARGEGTFDIVISFDGGWDFDGERGDRMAAYIQARRPIGSGFSWGIRLVRSVEMTVNVHIRGEGANWDTAGTAAAARAYINGLGIGQTVVRSMLFAIAHEYGADTVDVVTPESDVTPQWVVTPGVYGKAWAGEVTVEIII